MPQQCWRVNRASQQDDVESNSIGDREAAQFIFYMFPSIICEYFSILTSIRNKDEDTLTNLKIKTTVPHGFNQTHIHAHVYILLRGHLSVSSPICSPWDSFKWSAQVS